MTIEPAGCREVKKLTIRNVFEQSAGGVKVIQDWPCKLSISTYRKRFLLVYIYINVFESFMWTNHLIWANHIAARLLSVRFHSV